MPFRSLKSIFRNKQSNQEINSLIFGYFCVCYWCVEMLGCHTVVTSSCYLQVNFNPHIFWIRYMYSQAGTLKGEESTSLVMAGIDDNQIIQLLSATSRFDPTPSTLVLAVNILKLSVVPKSAHFSFSLGVGPLQNFPSLQKILLF